MLAGCAAALCYRCMAGRGLPVVVVATWTWIGVLGLEGAAAAPSPPRRRVPWRAHDEQLRRGSNGSGPSSLRPPRSLPCTDSVNRGADLSSSGWRVSAGSPQSTAIECRARHMHNVAARASLRFNPAKLALLTSPSGPRGIARCPGTPGVFRLLCSAAPRELVARFKSRATHAKPGSPSFVERNGRQ
jgi:hypothetical protein